MGHLFSRCGRNILFRGGSVDQHQKERLPCNFPFCYAISLFSCDFPFLPSTLHMPLFIGILNFSIVTCALNLFLFIENTISPIIAKLRKKIKNCMLISHFDADRASSNILSPMIFDRSLTLYFSSHFEHPLWTFKV